MKKFPIDLSCLTEEEISQFQEDPYTLYNGDQDVALYLRYSSTGQSDQSIEGQLRDCRTFCKANRYRIVAIYVDRATTAHKDVEKRVHLMEMVADSAKQNWEYVIVWKLDRFARNRNDSAIIGDQSIHEYSDVSVISVDDKDVFQPCGNFHKTVQSRVDSLLRRGSVSCRFPFQYAIHQTAYRHAQNLRRSSQNGHTTPAKPLIQIRRI